MVGLPGRGPFCGALQWFQSNSVGARAPPAYGVGSLRWNARRASEQPVGARDRFDVLDNTTTKTRWIVTGKGHDNTHRPIGFVAIGYHHCSGLAIPSGQAVSNDRQLALHKLAPKRQRAPGHFDFLPHHPTRGAMTAARTPQTPRAGFQAATRRACRLRASLLRALADWKNGHRIPDTGPACRSEPYSELEMYRRGAARPRWGDADHRGTPWTLS